MPVYVNKLHNLKLHDPTIGKQPCNLGGASPLLRSVHPCITSLLVTVRFSDWCSYFSLDSLNQMNHTSPEPLELSSLVLGVYEGATNGFRSCDFLLFLANNAESTFNLCIDLR